MRCVFVLIPIPTPDFLKLCIDFIFQIRRPTEGQLPPASNQYSSMNSTQKTTLHVPMLVYFTSPLSQQERSLLVSQLNEPNEEFLQPYPHLPKLFHESPGNEVEGMPAEVVVETHKQWVKEHEVQRNSKHVESGSKFKSWPGSYMFVIAGDQESPHSPSSKVQVIHISGKSTEHPFDVACVRVASAAGLVNVAHVNGWASEGVAEDEAEEDGTTGGAGGTYASDTESTKRPPMTLPTKPRPADGT